MSIKCISSDQIKVTNKRVWGSGLREETQTSNMPFTESIKSIFIHTEPAKEEPSLEQKALFLHHHD